MLLGALLDLGLPKRALEADLAGLDVPFRLDVQRVTRGPLDANYVEVRLPQPRPGRARVHRHGRLVHVHAQDDEQPSSRPPRACRTLTGVRFARSAG